jgi:xanthine/uracil/vitamin C permease (AzgA family)
VSNSERTPSGLVLVRVTRLNAIAQGLATGVVVGVGLFLATIWLVIKGGPVVGPHLALLGEFLPGYRVTAAGSLVGLVYGIMIGFVAGYVVSRLYNWVAAMRGGEEPHGGPVESR